VVKNRGEVTLYSRRRNVLSEKFPYIAAALEDLPDATVIDGELVALDPKGRSSSTRLQNFRSAESHVHYYAFDILTHRGKDLTGLPLKKRRAILDQILPRNPHVNLSAVERRSPAKLLKFVTTRGLEGVARSAAIAYTSPANAPDCGRRAGSIKARNSS
jgi:ATP-dependent DNA ligase